MRHSSDLTDSLPRHEPPRVTPLSRANIFPMLAVYKRRYSIYPAELLTDCRQSARYQSTFNDVRSQARLTHPITTATTPIKNAPYSQAP